MVADSPLNRLVLGAGSVADDLGFMRAIVDEQGLSKEAADQRFTRIQALVGRVLGP